MLVFQQSNQLVVDDFNHQLSGLHGTHRRGELRTSLASVTKIGSGRMSGAGDAEFVASYTQDALDTESYSVSSATGAAIVNRFDDVDAAAYDECVYLTRTDWTGTMPSGPYMGGAWTASAEGVPLLEGSPLSVVCRVVDFYDTEVFDNLICKMEHSYAEASVLTRSGSVDYAALHPVLLEKSQDLYLRTSALSGTRRARRSRDS